MILSALTIFVVVAIATVPFTNWNAKGDGVPRGDEWAYGWFLLTFGILGTASFYGAVFSAFDPPISPKLHFGLVHTYRARIPAMIAAGPLTIGIPFIMIPLLLGRSTHFLFFDVLFWLIALPIGNMAGEAAARWSVGTSASIHKSARRLSRSILLLDDDDAEVVVSYAKGFLPILVIILLSIHRTHTDTSHKKRRSRKKGRNLQRQERNLQRQKRNMQRQKRRRGRREGVPSGE